MKEKKFTYDNEYLESLLKLMKYEAEKLGINFLEHYGIRICLNSGGTLNLTTNKAWNRFVRESKNSIYVKDHYSHYLKYVTREKLRYQIRRPEDADTEFLRCLAEAGMCNSLTIFTRVNDLIVAYFFVAPQDFRGATSLFCNNLHLFDRVANLMENKYFCKDNWDNNTNDCPKIITENDRRILFNKKNMVCKDGLKIFWGGKELFFTPKELVILRGLQDEITLKSLPKKMGVTPSGIDFHIHNIKRKIKATCKQEIIKFACDIRELI